MCLTKITKRFDPPDPKVRKGWKLVAQGPNEAYAPLFYPPNGRKPVPPFTRIPVNKWLKASNVTLQIDGPFSNSYRSGFHVYTSRITPILEFWTRAWKMVPVFYRNTRTMGRQSQKEVCHVADEIMYLDGDKHPAEVPSGRPKAKPSGRPKAKVAK